MTTPRNRRRTDTAARCAARITRPMLALSGPRHKTTAELARAWDRETRAYCAVNPGLPPTDANRAAVRDMLAAAVLAAAVLAASRAE